MDYITIIIGFLIGLAIVIIYARSNSTQGINKDEPIVHVNVPLPGQEQEEWSKSHVDNYILHQECRKESRSIKNYFFFLVFIILGVYGLWSYGIGNVWSFFISSILPLLRDVFIGIVSGVGSSLVLKKYWPK
jgi:hypothetical protein